MCYQLQHTEKWTVVFPGKYRHLNFQTYDRAMGEGQQRFNPTKFVSKWIYNQPGSIGYTVMNELCDASEPESNPD